MQKVTGEWVARVERHQKIGRRLKGSPIHPILAAMDTVKAGCVPRDVRFFACLERTDFPGERSTLRAVAKHIGVYEKVLTDFVYANDKRWKGTYREQILGSVELLCGSSSCLPWMTAGDWTCAPQWLLKSGAEERIAACVRTLALGLYRAQTTVSRQVGPSTITGPRAWWRAQWVGKIGDDGRRLTFLKPWLPDLAEDHANDFRVFIAAMWTCSLDVDVVIKSRPLDKERAFETFVAEREKMSAILSATAAEMNRGDSPAATLPQPRRSRSR